MDALEVIKILKVPCSTPLYKGLVIEISTSLITLKVPLSVNNIIVTTIPLISSFYWNKHLFGNRRGDA